MKKCILVLSLAVAVGAVSSCTKPAAAPQAAATADAPIEAQPLGSAPPPSAPAAAPPPVREHAFKPVAKRPGAASAPAPTADATASATPRPVPVPVPVLNSPVAEPAAPVAQTRPAAPPPPPPPPPPEPMKVTLKAGSVIAIRLGETLDSEKNATGDSFSASLAEPLVIDGFVIAERGARVSGKIVDRERAGRVKGVAVLQLALTEITTADNQRVPIVTDAFLQKGPDTTKSDAAKVGIATGIGAAIGAIAGKGKGAAIGAGAGGAAGAGTVLATRGKPAVLPAETLLRFQVTQAVTITEKL
ncbi:MAG: hypothetical protein NTX13_00780 [Acidobacteria bacterium]|nr:hypothetical protein [Acidobacteriota bacterium]